MYMEILGRRMSDAVFHPGTKARANAVAPHQVWLTGAVCFRNPILPRSSVVVTPYRLAFRVAWKIETGCTDPYSHRLFTKYRKIHGSRISPDLRQRSKFVPI